MGVGLRVWGGVVGLIPSESLRASLRADLAG